MRDRDGGGSHYWEDAASFTSDPDRRLSPASRPSSTVRDLRSMSARNMSQQSLDSGRYSFSRASTAFSDAGEGPDYLNPSSPAPTVDTTATYWSPFQAALSPSSTTSRAHSPTTSMTNLSSTLSHPNHHHLPSHSHQSMGRPGTSASSNETVYQQRLSEEKTRFFSDLRRTLTSLLLSDLGNLVFARGSETDAWFETTGQDCIRRREARERDARHAAAKEKRKTKGSPMTNQQQQRIVEKKRSFGDLRGATTAANNAEQTAAAGNDKNNSEPTGKSYCPTLRPASETTARQQRATRRRPRPCRLARRPLPSSPSSSRTSAS